MDVWTPEDGREVVASSLHKHLGEITVTLLHEANHNLVVHAIGGFHFHLRVVKIVSNNCQGKNISLDSISLSLSVPEATFWSIYSPMLDTTLFYMLLLIFKLI